MYARRVTPYAALDLDRDGLMRPLTDGMLALRYLSGFEGAALTAGALGGECTRCTATAIDDYAGGLGLALDVNGTNALSPIDGLLLIRYLFGFTGAALEGTPEDGSTRSESDDIIEYLLPLTTRQ